MSIHADAKTLLGWYDVHARTLPWRIPPGSSQPPDPYHVWLSEIMLQQTRVVVVRDYFTRFLELWPDVHALAAAPEQVVLGEWAGLGYYARARNLVKCARIVAHELGGAFPDTYQGLIALPGIGPYTAAAIAAIAFDRPEAVLDGNVERVLARRFAVITPLPAAKPSLHAHAARLTPRTRPGDYAQAIIDLGATICTPKSPLCGACPLTNTCEGREQNIHTNLPKRSPKAAKPVRRGKLWIARRADGAWLVERRPAKGLLGGMLGWPGAGWSETESGVAPLSARWRDPGVEIRHTFTHFHLYLTLNLAEIPKHVVPSHGFFIAPSEFRPTDMPSVMLKAFRAARPILAPQSATRSGQDIASRA